MSSRVFQSVIVQMKEATDRMIGVIDADSTVISCSGTGQWRASCSSCRASARPLSEVCWPVL